MIRIVWLHIEVTKETYEEIIKQYDKISEYKSGHIKLTPTKKEFYARLLKEGLMKGDD